MRHKQLQQDEKIKHQVESLQEKGLKLVRTSLKTVPHIVNPNYISYHRQRHTCEIMGLAIAIAIARKKIGINLQILPYIRHYVSRDSQYEDHFTETTNIFKKRLQK